MKKTQHEEFCFFVFMNGSVSLTQRFISLAFVKFFGGT